MKKLIGAFALALLISICLTSCGSQVPRPEVEEGRFNLTLTYEHNGEIKKLSGVYVCEYDGVAWWDINADPYVNWKTHLEGELNTESVSVCTTEDGGEILITLQLYPEYFMGDPECADFEPLVRAELFYYEGENGTISESFDDAELIAEYGVRVISFEYDEPIENVFE